MSAEMRVWIMQDGDSDTSGSILFALLVLSICYFFYTLVLLPLIQIHPWIPSLSFHLITHSHSHIHFRTLTFTTVHMHMHTHTLSPTYFTTVFFSSPLT